MKSVVKIAVVPVRDFRGKIVKTAKLDNDLEPIYLPVSCPDEKCDFTATNLEKMREHVAEHNGTVPNGAELSLILDVEDMNTIHLIFQVLTQLGSERLSSMQRKNDSFHASTIWRTAWDVMQNGGEQIEIGKSHYTWLHDFLDREFPKNDGPPTADLTIKDRLFGLSSHSMTEALRKE